MLNDKDTFQSRALLLLEIMAADTAFLRKFHPHKKGAINHNCQAIKNWMLARTKELDEEIAEHVGR